MTGPLFYGFFAKIPVILRKTERFYTSAAAFCDFCILTIYLTEE